MLLKLSPIHYGGIPILVLNRVWFPWRLSRLTLDVVKNDRLVVENVLAFLVGMVLLFVECPHSCIAYISKTSLAS